MKILVLNWSSGVPQTAPGKGIIVWSWEARSTIVDTLKMVVKLFNKCSWTCQYEVCPWSMIPFISGFTLKWKQWINLLIYTFILLFYVLFMGGGDVLFYITISWGLFKKLFILLCSCCCQSKCRFSRTRTLTHPSTLRNYSMMITISHLVEPRRPSVSSFVRVDHKLAGCFEGCHFPNCWPKNCRGDKSTKLDHPSQICQRNVTKLTSFSLNTQQTVVAFMTEDKARRCYL